MKLENQPGDGTTAADTPPIVKSKRECARRVPYWPHTESDCTLPFANSSITRATSDGDREGTSTQWTNRLYPSAANK